MDKSEGVGYGWITWGSVVLSPGSPAQAKRETGIFSHISEPPPVPYSGKLSREKTCPNWRIFTEETLADCSPPKDATLPNFEGKTFAKLEIRESFLPREFPVFPVCKY